jgi:hypothetical protein
VIVSRFRGAGPRSAGNDGAPRRLRDAAGGQRSVRTPETPFDGGSFMVHLSYRRLTLATAACVLLGHPAAAQIGGLVRRAASTATGDQGRSAAINVPADQRITAGTLDQLERGLAAQIAALTAAKQAQGNVKTPEAYQQCAGTTMMSPDNQKLAKDYSAAMAAANGNTEKAQAAMQKYSDNVQALVASKCGADPGKMQEKARTDAKNAEAKGQQASGFTPTLWSIFKERMAPFCNLPAAKRGNGDVHAEGQYVYLKSEADVLAPRCESIMAKFKSTT